MHGNLLPWSFDISSYQNRSRSQVVRHAVFQVQVRRGDRPRHRRLGGATRTGDRKIESGPPKFYRASKGQKAMMLEKAI
jgi:hypothetical protein